MPPPLLADVLAQELMRFRLENADVEFIPLHMDKPSDPAGRRTVVGRFDFDTTVQMHTTFAVLVIAKRLDRQWKQCRLLFGKHGSDLPLGRAVDAGVGPAGFP